MSENDIEPEPIFRAWDGLNKIMMDNTFYGSIPDTMKMFYSHKWKLMQYVGERDFHNGQIFTGDIIEFIYDNPFQKAIVIGIVQRVRYKFVTKNYVIESVFYLDHEHKKTREEGGMEYINILHLSATADCTIEIIGNIYENSITEILKIYKSGQTQNIEQSKMENCIKTDERIILEDNEKFMEWTTENKYDVDNKEMIITTEITSDGTEYKMFKKISQIII
ncbi:MAG: hypothetical protein BWK75_01360 [Candidatus Altiarchaeales archaeon A3]|nr:MAG: hypothetical protein BWK75_01360 [Candidatus Altiarchaeales archaeon A3]